MKKFLVGLAIFVAFAGTIGVFFGGDLARVAVFAYMTPDSAFDETPTPIAPDYADPFHWAALPDRKDSADLLPAGMAASDPASHVVDVFFVHPTTFVSSEGWNQPLENDAINKRTDQWVMRDQASIFNGCCRVYAPRYRQATLSSFNDMDGSGGQALDLAFSDVKTAFEYFQTHYSKGRPFILAGHSQGAFHGDRLLREVIENTPLVDRMVAAYTIGFGLKPQQNLPVCSDPSQTNCQISWNAAAADAGYKIGAPGDICVNPLTWRADKSYANFSQNTGALTYADGDALQPGVADGECADGNLIVSEVRSENFGFMPFGPGNYHMYDYSFYHMNIRENLQTRTAAFLAKTMIDG